MTVARTWQEARGKKTRGKKHVARKLCMALVQQPSTRSEDTAVVERTPRRHSQTVRVRIVVTKE